VLPTTSVKYSDRSSFAGWHILVDGRRHARSINLLWAARMRKMFVLKLSLEGFRVGPFSIGIYKSKLEDFGNTIAR
jgi:hypothetical protein